MYYKKDFKEFLMTNNVKYDFAIIDPPWNYNSKPPAVMNNQLTYSLWNNDDLKFIIDNINVDYIFMWTTNSFVPNVIDSIKGTNYEYKTIFTWVKTTPKGNLFYGLGNTFRNCTEQIIVLQKKKTKALNLSLRNCVLSRANKRTLKPKDFEKELVKALDLKGLKGVYIFSGGELDFIDCVDVI